MKEFFNNLIFFCVMLVWLFPLLFGAVDMACVFVTAHACTSIPWSGGRVFGAFAWVGGWLCFAALVMS